MLLASTLAAALPARSEALHTAWRTSPQFQVTGISQYTSNNGRATTVESVAATAELKISSALKPWYGGFFADYRDSASEHYQANLNLGAYFRYNLPRWDATAWLFSNRPVGGDAAWLYATRLRYRIAGDHKVGVETLTPVNDASAHTVLAGYYGNVGRALSLKILAGSDVGDAADVVARIEVSWQVW